MLTFHMTVVSILSMLAPPACIDPGDREATEKDSLQAITASAPSVPQDRLDLCKKNKVSPCTYTYKETRALLAPGGAAYEQLLTTATQYKLLKIQVLFKKSDKSRIDIIYYKVPKHSSVFPAERPVVIVDLKEGAGTEIPNDFQRFLAAFHHWSGAHESNSQEFVTGFGPTLVQYSAGQQYGHPALAVARRYENSLATSRSPSHGLVAWDRPYRIFATKENQYGTAYEGSRLQSSTVVYRNNQVAAKTSKTSSG
jgi:hypothetical protein